MTAAIIWFAITGFLLAFTGSTMVSQIVAGIAARRGGDYASWGTATFVISFIAIILLLLAAWYFGALSPVEQWRTPFDG